MLMLLLLALHVVFIDCRCPPQQIAPRAIDTTDGVGQYAGSVNVMDTISSNNPEDATDPGEVPPSADYSEQPDDGSTRIVAELDYGSLCRGERLACCKPLTEEDRSWPTRPNGTPELPASNEPQCIWESAFDPNDNPLHDWIGDWCLDQNLACCTSFPERLNPAWSECQSLGLPAPKLEHNMQPSGHGICRVRPALGPL